MVKPACWPSAPSGASYTWRVSLPTGTTIPILRIFDEAKAREFYVEFLGFRIDWEHRFEDGLPLYMGVSRGNAIFRLSEHHGDATPGSAVRIVTDDIDAYCAELVAKDYKYYRPAVETMPWARDMSITDPFGNRLIFTAELDD